MTALNVSLSATLQGELSQPGAWAYAAYKDPTTGSLIWTSLVTNGAVASGGTVSIALPSTFDGGKIYFLIQSQAATDPQPFDLETLITTESQINWGTASQYGYRYDSFEVTLLDQGADAGNLTSVNGFGLPMAVSIPYDNGTTATAGYGITGAQLVSGIQAINPALVYTYNYTTGPLAGQFRAALSPSEAFASGITDPPFKASDWNDYIDSLKGPQAENIVLTGQFNGAPDAEKVWHNGGYFAFQLQWDDAEQVFWLAPLDNSQIKGFIRLTPDNLANSIYSTLGDADIYTSKTDATPFLAGMNTGANNQWGKVLLDLLTGFTAGFYNATGQSPNDKVTTPVDLNRDNNWEPTYAFGQNLASLPPAYQTNDAYSALFYASTNSYGSGYSDALMSKYTVGGPLLSVSEPDTGLNVPNINLTIFADSETPTGYTPPQYFNYIDPGSSGFAVPDIANPSANFVLNLASSVQHNVGVVLDPTATITLRIMTSNGGSGAPTWAEVAIDGSSGGSFGLWQNWNLNYNAATGSYTAVPFTPPSQQPSGSLLINQVPTASTGVSWYQIEIGGKDFNLYTTNAGAGKFVNPGLSGNAGALAIDGLATITPPAVSDASIGTFSVNFASGDTVAYDPAVIVVNTANVGALSLPYAPVVGTLSGAAFTALSGQNSPVSNTVTATSSNLAFGWTGLNPLSTTGDTPWIMSYTNKIDGLTIARITVTSTVDSSVAATTTATADIDGAWQTSSIHLANGSYTVTMQGFLAGDTSFAEPVTPVSEVLNLTVAAITDVVPCFRLGTRIATPDGEVAVESLCIGDTVLADGAPRDVIWIGHRTVDCARHPNPAQVWPIRIEAGAFGPAEPRRPLFLSPDHAVFQDGALIPVKYLVNGTTVTQVAVESVTYFHVELARHAVLLAEGLPAESYLDTGDRSDFANGGGVVRLHPEFASLRREAEACAPLVITGPVLEAVRDRLAAARLSQVA